MGIGRGRRGFFCRAGGFAWGLLAAGASAAGAFDAAAALFVAEALDAFALLPGFGRPVFGLAVALAADFFGFFDSGFIGRVVLRGFPAASARETLPKGNACATENSSPVCKQGLTRVSNNR